ncbi:MAG: hypothetical protein V1732_03580 [Patescibacteria group bacterium]
MGFIEDNSKWFFKRTVFLWLPFAAIILLIRKWSEKKDKNEEE